MAGRLTKRLEIFLPFFLLSFWQGGSLRITLGGEEISFRKKIVISFSSIDRVSLKNLIIIMMMM